MHTDESLKKVVENSSHISTQELEHSTDREQQEEGAPNYSKASKRAYERSNDDDDDLPTAAKRARAFHEQSEHLLESQRLKCAGGRDSPHKFPPPAPPSTPRTSQFDGNSLSQNNMIGHCENESSVKPPLSETKMALSSEGDGSFSALSSACSSPSNQHNMSTMSASAINELTCKPHNWSAISRNNSLGSIGSAASSTSSASYIIPPAPPSTPVKGLMMNLDPTLDNGEGDIYLARDIDAQQQQHYAYTDAYTMAGKPRFQDMATPTPNKVPRSRVGASEIPSSLHNQTVFENDDTPYIPDINHTSSDSRVEPQRPSHPPTTTSSHHSTSAPPSQPDNANASNDISDDFLDWKVGPRYKLIRILGQGSYGEVAQARDLLAERDEGGGGGEEEVPKYVAIKRINKAFEQEVDALRLFREIHILRRLRGHKCIIQLLDIVPPESDNIDEFRDLYLVFEYVDTDLYKLIMSPQYLTTEHIQTFLYQMLTGLKYIHSSSVIHRDLKPANILLNEDCSLKICDFGLARIVNSETVAKGSDGNSNASNEPNIISKSTGLTRQLTKHVVTRWYRAPELILIQPYTSAVDIWSLGCILAELLSMQEDNVPGYQDRVPLFPGGSCYPLSGEGDSNDERLDQLSVILGVIGTPSSEDVESVGNANYYVKSLTKQPSKSLESIYPAADRTVIDLLKMMLQFNPKKRCTTEEALEHEFLSDVRRREMEKTVDQPLIGPQFLNSNKISLEELKRRTFEEVMLEKRSKLSTNPRE